MAYLFPGVKRSERGVDHPLPSSVQIRERVDLYLHPLWTFKASYKVNCMWYIISPTLAMGKVVGYLLLYAEALDRIRASSFGICGGQNGTEINFSSRSWSFPRQCRSTNTLYWFVRLLYSQRYIFLATDSVGVTLENHICV